MHNGSNIIARSGVWFLHSGIQHASGGVARYYRSDLGKNARVSTEITGYAAGTLTFFYERSGNQEYLERARRTARFLTQTAWDPHAAAFPFEHSDNGDCPEPHAYFFDSGIIVRGLLSVWRLTGEPDLLRSALEAGRAMIADFQTQKAIHPILVLPEKTPLPYRQRWSASPGCYQLKSALAWHELAVATGDRSFAGAYESAVAYALQDEREFLPGDRDLQKVMDRLHAFAYFLEGLLPVGLEHADVFRSGLDRIAVLLRQIETEFARSDVYAQLLRLRLYADALGIAPLDESAAAYEAGRASAFQLSSEDARIDGGFGFGRRCGVMAPFVNPVSTAFCAQALAFWDDYCSGKLKVFPESLI